MIILSKAMQSSFSALAYSAKKKQTRRDRFQAEIEVIMPWPSLTQVIVPHYLSNNGPGSPLVRQFLGKRKDLSKSTQDELLARIEPTKASIRAKVEHPFHVIKNLFRHRKTRYQRLAKNPAPLFSLFGFANLMLARRWLFSGPSQVAS